MCIDDFAIKMRLSYGTIMVDIFSHKIIDLIPSRKVADVETWLSTFQNLKLISREGAIIYKTAISNAHEHAIQIPDRFYLIKNLTEYAQDAIKRMISPKVFISESDNSIVEASLVLETLETSVNQRKPKEPVLFHTDRGTQYRATSVRQFLDTHNLVPSYSKAAYPWDNAVNESFLNI